MDTQVGNSSHRGFTRYPPGSRAAVCDCACGWVGGWVGRGGGTVRGGGEQYKRLVSVSTTRVNACHNASTRQSKGTRVPIQAINPFLSSVGGGDGNSPRPACSGSLIRTQGRNNDGIRAVQASANILLSHSLRAPRRARSYNVTTFIVRAAPWRHARRHAAPAVPRPCAAQPEGFCNLGRSRKARGALP